MLDRSEYPETYSRIEHSAIGRTLWGRRIAFRMKKEPLRHCVRIPSRQNLSPRRDPYGTSMKEHK